MGSKRTNNKFRCWKILIPTKILFIWKCILQWNLYNEVLGLTNYFFFTPVIVKYKAIWKRTSIKVNKPRYNKHIVLQALSWGLTFILWSRVCRSIVTVGWTVSLYVVRGREASSFIGITLVYPILKDTPKFFEVARLCSKKNWKEPSAPDPWNPGCTAHDFYEKIS